MAAEAGLDIADLAIEAVSGLTSQPSLNSLVEALKGTPRDTGLDTEELTELSRYYASTRKLYQKFESEMNTPNTEIYKYEIPGGQYSNLLAQVKEMASADDFSQIKELYKQANDLLGNIVKVTPSSKVVGDLSIFMYNNDLTAENILEKGKDLSYPDSLLDYFRGMMGQPDGGFPTELQKIVLKGEQPINVRPGSLLPAEDMDKISAHLKDTFNIVSNSRNQLSYALYPKVYDDYCKHLDYYHDVSKLPTHIYFYGMAKGEETTVKIAQGKYLIIKFVDVSDANEQGIRSLTFEVNGAMREISIVDRNQETKSDQKRIADKGDMTQLGSPIPGKVSKVLVAEGDTVTLNTPLMVIEAMKMETTLLPKKEGIVEKIYVCEGDSISQNELLISFTLKS